MGTGGRLQLLPPARPVFPARPRPRLCFPPGHDPRSRLSPLHLACSCQNPEGVGTAGNGVRSRPVLASVLRSGQFPALELCLNTGLALFGRKDGAMAMSALFCNGSTRIIPA